MSALYQKKILSRRFTDVQTGTLMVPARTHPIFVETKGPFKEREVHFLLNRVSNCFKGLGLDYLCESFSLLMPRQSFLVPKLVLHIVQWV